MWPEKLQKFCICLIGCRLNFENIFFLQKSSDFVCQLLTSHELRHEISNNVVCETNKASDQPAHMRSLIRAFPSHLNIL